MFKRYFEDELEFLREMGAEFSAAYPDIAGELGVTGRDPDVERLLQGVAFLTARIRESLDAGFPELLHPLLGQVWPHAIRPTPSVGIVEFRPRAGAFQEVYRIKRGAAIRSIPIDGTSCQFRTAYDLDILPLSVEEVRAVSQSSSRFELEVKLQLFPGASLQRLAEPRIRFHLHGSVRQVFGLHLSLLRDVRAIRVQGRAQDGRVLAERRLPETAVRPVGWELEHALLPYPATGVTAHLHLHEYFLFPGKYQFVDLVGLEWVVGLKELHTIALTFEVGAAQGEPFGVSKENLRLHCTPVVNLFPLPARPLSVDLTRTEYLVRPEGGTIEHYDLFSVERIAGYSRTRGRSLVYQPFYTFRREEVRGEPAVYYQLHPRSSVARREGEREAQTSYPGVDTYVSFVDARGDDAALAGTVSIDLLATNRELPGRLRLGDVSVSTTDIPTHVSFANITPFSPASAAPIGRDSLWRFFAQMTLGWSQLSDREALCGLLSLYHGPARHDHRARQELEVLSGAIDRVARTSEQRVIGRPPALVWGTHVAIAMHEGRFAHPGELYLFGTALSHFLGEVSTVNTYTRLTITGIDQGMELIWPPRMGRQTLV